MIDNISFHVFGKPNKNNDRQRKLILTTEIFVNIGIILVDTIFLCGGVIPINGFG